MVRGKFAVFAAVLGIFVAGCASTATGISSSAMLTSETEVPFQAKTPAGSALVVVRYPATIEPDAEDAYHNAYMRSAIGGSVGRDAANNPDATSIADTTIVKSNYFALSLYKELAKRLPDHSVLLSPHSITLDEDGKLTSTPLTSAERIASVLTVDFSTYSFPDPEKMMSREPLTFGDLITPLVVVHTDYRAATPTKGLLLASEPLMAQAGGNADAVVEKFLNSAQAGTLEPAPRELHFISFLSGKASERLSTQRLQMSGMSNSVQSYPLEKITLDRVALAQLNVEGGQTSDPLESVFSRSLANRVVALLNKVDTEKAAMVRRAAAVSNFDQNLAALSLVGARDSDYSVRMKYAERLLEAERKYLSVQSLRIFDGVHNGEMGAQVRDMLIAERNVLDERRDLARQQNLATAGAILGAIVTGVVISESGDNTSAGEAILADVIARASILAATQAYAINRQSKSISSNYLTSIVPALEEQLEVQIDLLGSSETITAIRFEDLREKLQTLYSENQRSIETFATVCAYTHTGAEVPGKWQGVCENGRADGPGIGIITYEDGTSIEYYGEALNGRPHGTGYLIEHSEVGSYSIEGRFANGIPEGVVKVSRAGRPDRLRVYRDGKDTGAAAPGSQNPQLFSVNSVISG